ncbi:unnamed protein product [Rangifer tarandus platyrhynchus]|uniref:Uncharacterized protein n=1 Tax=Rangifer tarandus platyrhynchus TaxID=3082113 RepID=A0ABN8ZHE1_RANTA|nr:unnamed protein product [Rangifer tarandus platyrhynchus]
MISVRGVIEAVGTDKRVTGECREERWTRPDCPMQGRCGSGKQLGFPGPVRMPPVVLSGVGRRPTSLRSAGVPRGRLARATSILPVFNRETGSEKCFSTIRTVRAQRGWQTIAHGPSQPTACFCT